MNAKPRILVWHVDTQEDFMRRGGRFYVEGSELVFPYLKAANDFAHDYDITTVHQGDAHDETSIEISSEPNWKTTFPMHCERNTPGMAFIEEIKPKNPYVIDFRDKTVDREKIRTAKEIVLYKDGVDIYNARTGNPHIDTVLDVLKPDIIIADGTVRSICVDYFVVGTRSRDIELYVLKNGVQGLPNIPAEGTLQKWERLGVHLRDTTDLPDLAKAWNLEKVVQEYR